MKNIILISVIIYVLTLLYGCGADSGNTPVFVETADDVSRVNPDDISSFYGTYKLLELNLDDLRIHPSFTKGFASMDENGLTVKIRWGASGDGGVYIYENVSSAGSLAEADVIIRPRGRGIRTEFIESGAGMIFEKISDKISELEDEPFDYGADDMSKNGFNALTGTYEVISGYFYLYAKENDYAQTAGTCYAEQGGRVSIHMPSETAVYRMDLRCAYYTGTTDKNIRLEVKRAADTFTERRWNRPPTENEDGTLNLTLTQRIDGFTVSGEVRINKIYNAFRMYY